ncbi:MAG: AAA family ATPase [Fibrobacter sp.]|nr:AAA family ATPase [Fibrobacter sp.]
MQLTEEQKAIIECPGNAKIQAVAGSGKTSTLIEYARRRGKNRKILYLAFNRSVKIEAQNRFQKAGLPNVRVETAHSLAWNSIVAQSGYKVRTAYKPWEIVNILNIKPVGRDPVSATLIGGHVGKFVSVFCNHTNTKVQDIDYRNFVTDKNAHGFVQKHYEKIVDGTRRFLAMMNNSSIEITHEFYLKKFQLASPDLYYDIILFDEGQDASPVMLDVFLNQHKTTRIIVGDPHQQIYGWRFATNALDRIDYQRYDLTTSFRFPQSIADLALSILQWKKHLNSTVDQSIKGIGNKPEKISTALTLARTNLSLLRNAINFTCSGKKKKKIYFEGNINSYTYASEGASIWDVLNLYLQKKENIKDPVINQMETLDELQEYADLSEDTELLTLIEIVNEHGKQLPFYMNKLKENHVTDQEKAKADMIFSTVHKCKGLEYDFVTLEDDFISEKKLIRTKDKMDISTNDLDKLTEEINLLYVAVTRSKGNLSLPENLLQDLPWPSHQIHQNSRTTVSLRKKDHSKAYNAWTPEEDQRLKMLLRKNYSLKKISSELQRGKGAIMSRIRKLGLYSNI